MKPLTSYYGGKQRIATKILPYFPPHTVYVEPFAGGATLLFAKKHLAVTNNDHYREIINDTNQLLINMYRVAIEKPEQFKNKLDATLYSQADYVKANNIINNFEHYLDIDLAWAYFITLNQSFNNIANNGWSTTVYGRNHAATWNNKINSLSPEMLNRIKSVYVSCEDAIKCIKRWDSPQTLFYCDPPYPKAEQGHYKGYSIEDFRLLCNTLDNIKGSYVLSNYQQEIEPKSATNKVEINATMSASKATNTRLDSSRSEILWICDRSNQASGKLTDIIVKNQKLMAATW